VRSIFKWITENISYRVRSLYLPARISLAKAELVEDTTTLKPLNERVARIVLENKLAVCDGYARLFKTLCDYANVKCEIIAGFADGGYGSRKFRSNHKWNAVYLDSTWHLLDVTWASGGTNYSGDRFIKNFNEQYFLMHPADFIRDHYPDDLRWTLLSNPPVINEFKHAPLATASFYKNYVTSFKPVKGIIEASLGDTLQFELETDGTIRDAFVVDNNSVDSAVISWPIWREIAKTKTVGRKITCTYVVVSEEVDWLSIVLNEDVILRYKLNVKKSFAAKD
jgi:transglutaminase/protease-like cytokinesis protein 3